MIDYSWQAAPENYSRELDLETGITSSSFTVGGKRVIQETYISAPDNIIIVLITSPDGLPLNASVSLAREKDAVISASGSNVLKLAGQIIDQDNPKSGPGGAHMKFSSELRVKTVKRALLLRRRIA